MCVLNLANIAKIQAIIDTLLGLLQVSGVSSTTVTEIQKYLNIAVELISVEAGLLPATSLANDVTDVDTLLTALQATGLLPAAESAAVSKYVGEFDNLLTEYKNGQPILAGKVTLDGIGGTIFLLPDGSTSEVAVDLGLATAPGS